MPRQAAWACGGSASASRRWRSSARWSAYARRTRRALPDQGRHRLRTALPKPGASDARLRRALPRLPRRAPRRPRHGLRHVLFGLLVRENERVHDLIDLQLMEELIEDYSRLEAASVEIFELRRTHAWPPTLTAEPTWPETYRGLAAGSNSRPRTSPRPSPECRVWSTGYRAQICQTKGHPSSLGARLLASRSVERRSVWRPMSSRLRL
jgi:hypothetical protein